MLRPATPLAIIFFVAFVLLLLSTISTPIIKQVPLGQFQGWEFGVFGYCKGGAQCKGPMIGYSTDGLFTGADAHDFSLPSATRHSLSSILIVHPIAALLTLICFALSVAAHFHGPASSPRYLLALLILTIPTLLVTLLAFLVDILLFVPHVGWGGWIVLGATILIVASSVVTCAMRRTLASRKARKKRIAENADMSGANYYENLNQTRLMQDQLPRADSPPPMSGTTAQESKEAPGFATFEMKREASNGQSPDGGRRSMDDRTPLNPVRDPSVRSASTGGARRPYPQGEGMPPMPMNGGPHDRMASPRRPSRDEYGNPLPAMAGAGVLAGEGLRHQTSEGSLGSHRSNGRGGAPPMYGRGRGGYGPPPRGGYGPPRAGYGPPRGGYGPRGAYRGGPPPPGWNGRGGGRGGRGNPGMIPGMSGPPPNYGGDGAYPPSPRNGPPPMSQMRPSPDQFIARGPSPGNDLAIGQAIEMDERTGSPPVQGQQGQQYGLRDSDNDVAGMVGLQQGRNSPFQRDSEQPSDYPSTGSNYSEHTYVPPRAAWNQQQARGPVSPITTDSASSGLASSNALPTTGSYSNLPPIQASPTSPQQVHMPHHARQTSEPYYEDVDPRFASNEVPSALTPGSQTQARTHPSPPQIHYTSPPASLAGSGAVAGGPPAPRRRNADEPLSAPPQQILNRNSDPSNTTPPAENSSYEDLPPGVRSPTGSDTSHFTSVSQRPVNPNWRPANSSAGQSATGAYPGGFLGPGSTAPTSASAVQRRREDVVLSANPDFALPGISPGRGARGGRGGMAGGQRSSMLAAGLTPAGRYPTEI
nr:hypothetical protein B0A51_10373 [Rachicladosporium sp. CCFEE 5018]